MFEDQKERLGFKLAQKLDEEHGREHLRNLLLAGITGNLLCWSIAMLTPASIADWVSRAMHIGQNRRLPTIYSVGMRLFIGLRSTEASSA